MSVVAFTVGDLGFTIPLGAAREVLRVRVADGRVHRAEVESGTRWLFPLPEAPPAVAKKTTRAAVKH